MILLTTDRSGAKQFFAGFYRDNTVCWSTHEHVALDKSLGELKAVVHHAAIEQYTIRERLPEIPIFYVRP